MKEQINKLSQYRDDLLKAEIATYFILMDKTNIKFWQSKGYLTDLEPVELKFDEFLNTLFLKNYFIDFFDESNQQKSYNLIDDLLKKWRSANNPLQKILARGCENVNSGIDKGALPKSQKIQGELYISNAFGSFMQRMNPDCLDTRRECFLQSLHDELTEKNFYENPDWQAIRDFVCNEIKCWYSNLLSDTRFPANDVTLWDQAYMTASMFKATLADCYLQNNASDKMSNPQSIQWRILGIQYDKLGLAEKASKPAIIATYRNECKEFDKQVKAYLETEIAIGNEIYRDETGIYFLVPENLPYKEVKADNKLLVDLFDEENIINAINHKAYDKFNNEVQPVYVLSRASRGTMNLTQLLQKAKELRLYAPQFDKRNLKNESNGSQICRVCRIRFAENENNEANNDIPLCKICNNRKVDRLKEWHANRNNETIWLDELQDKNNRIALLTIRFELNQWLNGNMLSSCVNQLLKNGNSFNDIRCSLAKELKQTKEKKINKSAINDYQGDIPNQSLEAFVKTLIFNRALGNSWFDLLNKLFSGKIDIDQKKIEWNKFSDEDYKEMASIPIQFLFRKNPSPARLRRIWESTQRFTNEIHNEVATKLSAKRIVWDVDKWEESYQNKEIEINGLLIYLYEGKAFLITSLAECFNQIYNFKNDEVKNFEDWLKNDKNDINEFKLPPKLKKDNKDITILHSRFEDYQSLVSLLDPTPVSWQVAVPADRVPGIIDLIREKYKEHFHYVYGKLPLHIGVVVQNFKHPLYIGMQALRNIRREVEWKEIESKIDGIHLKAIQKDQVTEANSAETYYSLHIRNDKEGDYTFRFPPEEKNKHVSLTSENEEADKFFYYPNTIDFEFLDCNTRRNDIFYEKGKRKSEYRHHRPFTWEHWYNYHCFRDLFAKDSSQLQNLISLFYRLLQDWKNEDESALQLAATSIINMLRPQSMSNKNKAISACLFGAEKWEDITEKIQIKHLLEFIDYYDFWHNNLKEV
jgi:CRISPR-associated Csx11 family protein